MADTDQAELGLQAVPLRKPPDRRILIDTPRRMDQVDPALAAVFRELVAGKKPWPLYLHGQVGTGKTRAALCLCDFAKTATFHAVDRLCDFVMRKPAGEVDAEWEMIETKALAVLDELGEREKVTDLQTSVVKQYLDARELHAGRICICISNLAPGELPGLYDDRIVSRLLSGTVFALTGPDRRRAE